MATPALASSTAVAPPMANKSPVVGQNTLPKRPAAPSLNTSMLEAKLNNAKKIVPHGPNATLNALGNALRPSVKATPALPGSAKIPVPKAAAAAPVKTGSTPNASANLSAKLALANANKTSQATTNTVKPASALRAAALASAKAGNKVIETKSTPTPASKPAGIQQAQQAKGPAGKQPASPVASNKQATNKAGAAAAAAGGGTLDNIKILTFEEIMAQKRAKKEAEKAAATKSPTPPQRPQALANKAPPSGGSPKPQPANVAKAAAIAKPVVEKANTPSPTPTAPVASTPAVAPGSINTIKKSANGKAVNVAGQTSTQPATSTNNTSTGQVKKPNQPKVNPQIATSQAKAAANISSPVNNTAHSGTKRPAEGNNQAMPAAKKVAGEELKTSPKPPVSKAVSKPATAMVATPQAKAPAAVTPKVPTINKQVTTEATAKVTAVPEKVTTKRPLEADEPISNKKPAMEKPAMVQPTSQQPPATAKPAASEKSAIEKPLVPTESIQKKQEPSFDADDELAQFEAEFGGDLGELEGGDIQDFDEDSLMKELEELEQA